jgi:GDP-L-fucose synthase
MTEQAPATNPLFELAGRRVWVAGHRGMVGSALVRRLEREACQILAVDRGTLDLRDQSAVHRWMMEARPEVVFLAAARVGGILANNSYPGQFLHDNLAIQTNVIEGAHRAGVAKLLFLGSSCIYPRMAPQPIPEGALLTGPLEPTNEWYAIAKIAGLKLAEAYRREYGCHFISAMPTNLYGPGDNFDLEKSHVLPALLRKVHEAKEAGRDRIVVWGSGRPRREFMHVDDCADALVFLVTHYSAPSHVNVGTGSDVSIHELGQLVCDVVGFGGRIELDRDKPDGTPRKLLDSTLLNSLGWSAKIELRDGIERTYRWYREHLAEADRGTKAAHG